MSSPYVPNAVVTQTFRVKNLLITKILFNSSQDDIIHRAPNFQLGIGPSRKTHLFSLKRSFVLKPPKPYFYPPPVLSREQSVFFISTDMEYLF